MITAYDRYRGQVDTRLKKHPVFPSPDEVDEFILVVRKRFFMGVHTAFQESILRVLSEQIGTQQEIADALGLKDRTSISKMISSGTIEGIRLTAAFYLVPDIISQLPTRERAALYGFARATSFIKALAYKDDSIEGAMKPQDFAYLVGVLASADWDKAARDTNPVPLRQVANQIVTERRISMLDPVFSSACREEQYVLKLQELKLNWGDFAVIALWAIPECIPE